MYSEKVLWPDPSAFNKKGWDVFEAEGFLDFSPNLRFKNDEYSDKYGVGFVADAFYALSGIECNPNDPLGVVWEKMIAEPEFEKMAKEAKKSREQMALACLALTDSLVGKLLEKAEEVYEKKEVIIEGDPPQDPNEPPLYEPEPLGPEIPEILEKTNEAIADKWAVVRSALTSIDPTLPPTKRFEESIQVLAQFDAAEFARILGWAETHSNINFRPATAESGDLTGYTGNSLSENTDQMDLMGLVNDEPLALKAFAESDLLTSVHEDKKGRGPGPVIYLNDESTSMVEFYDERFLRSRMIEVALGKVFADQERDLHYLGWSAAMERTDPTYKNGYKPKVVDYLHGDPGLMERLFTNMGGRTNIIPALEHAIKVAQGWGEDCDILIVTDGEIKVKQLSVKAQREMLVMLADDFRKTGGKIYCVCLDDATENKKTLESFCDGFVMMDELQTTDDFGALIRAMAARQEEQGRIE